MSMNAANVIAAYSNTARAPMPTAEVRSQPGASFANLIQNAAETALTAGQASERTTVQALSGNAELSEVVTAVANAEVALQTVVAVRDKVVTAYQEIMRMPI